MRIFLLGLLLLNLNCNDQIFAKNNPKIIGHGHNNQIKSSKYHKNYLVPPPPPYVPSISTNYKSPHQVNNLVNTGTQSNPYLWERNPVYSSIDNSNGTVIKPNKYLTYFN